MHPLVDSKSQPDWRIMELEVKSAKMEKAGLEVAAGGLKKNRAA